LPRLVFVSILLITLNQVIQLYGLKYITAGLAAVISSALTPISLLGFAVAFGQEGITGRQIAALALGAIGVATLFGPSAIRGTLNASEAAGALGVTIGCLCYTAGSVMTRPMMGNFGAVQLAGLTNLIGGVILLLASIALEPGAGAALAFDWGWRAILAWLYLLIPGALLSTTMYFLLVRDWGASKPGLYAFISPIIAVVIGATCFHERLDWGDAVGMALMLGAAGLALRRAPAVAHPRGPR
jgi:drug/metabolite transporter (DMT)-like permease